MFTLSVNGDRNPRVFESARKAGTHRARSVGPGFSPVGDFLSAQAHNVEHGTSRRRLEVIIMRRTRPSEARLVAIFQRVHDPANTRLFAGDEAQDAWHKTTTAHLVKPSASKPVVLATPTHVIPAHSGMRPLGWVRFSFRWQNPVPAATICPATCLYFNVSSPTVSCPEPKMTNDHEPTDGPDHEPPKRLSQKEFAKKMRREAYLRAKERRKTDPRQIAMAEKLKQQRRDAYQKVKERGKALRTERKKAEAEKAAAVRAEKQKTDADSCAS